MNYLAKATSHYRSTLCILLLIIVAGVFSRWNTPVETNPPVTIPFVSVSVYLDGVSPEDATRLLVRPLEKELQTIEGIDELMASASESNAVMIVKFEAEEDVDKAVREVREAVDRAKSELPLEAEEPVVNELSADDFPAIVVTLSGEDIQERQIFQSAQQIKRALEKLPGVLKANMVGHREEVVEAIVNPARLEHYQITSAELASAVINNNLLIPAGELDSGKGRFSIKIPGLIETYQDVIDLPLKSTSNGLITLSDIADVRRTFKDPKRFTSVNGQPAITIEIQKRTTIGSIELSQQVRNTVESQRDQLPHTLNIDYALDQSNYTQKMVDEMQGNIITAMALVMIIVVAALGFRSGLLVGLGIPFSLLFSLIITYSIGFSFNFMVMFGMLLALGMLIDGAIVITEFADRKMADGASSKVAYAIAVERMFWPVISSTATTLAAFLPVMFWPGVAGEFMRYLPVTVFAILFGSLFYALLFAPVLGAHIGKNSLSKDTRLYLQALESSPPTSLAGITGRYARLLAWLVNHPIRIAGICSLVLITIFMLYGELNAGVKFFAKTESKYGSASVRALGNLSATETRDLVREVEQRIIEVDGVLMAYTASGTSNSLGPKPSIKDQIGTIMIELDDPETLNRSTHDVFAEIRDSTAKLAGIIVDARGFENGPPVGKPVQIQLEGNDRQLLIKTARRIKAHMENSVPGLRNISDTTPLPGIEWEIQVDRQLAAQFGVNLLNVGHAVQLVTNGIKIGEYRPDDADEEIDIRIRYPQENRGLSMLDNIRVNTPEGVIPVSDFVKRVAKRKVDKINRSNATEIVTVKSDLEEDVLADDKVKEIKSWLKTQTIDPSITIVFRGANEEQRDSLSFLSVAFSLALFLMFILLVTQFNSFYQGFLILSAVVMSTAGVLLGLLITQSTFSVILTGIGIVALAGIVVNNNIILIDTFNHLRRNHNLSPAEAVISAGAQRLRPVFLTTLTTIMGMLPIALNTSIDLVGRTVISGGVISSTWAPLSSAIVHGLLFSTILTLIVTPVLLVLPSEIKRHGNSMLKRLKEPQ